MRGTKRGTREYAELTAAELTCAAAGLELTAIGIEPVARGMQPVRSSGVGRRLRWVA